jgi:ParB-like chromosome segregation protein Spo0J
MEKVGLIESLMVKPLPRKDGEYEIISGHRRWEIAKKKGWKTIRCDVYADLDEATVMYLVGSHNFLRV